jgi:Skp family chaperone for outer membrane proteins
MRHSLVVLLIILAGIGLIIGGAFYFLRMPVRIEPQSVKVAVIDSTLIKTQSLPFVRVRELLDKEHSRIHEEILAQELKLREEHEQLKSSKASAEEKQQQKLGFDKKIAALEQSVQKIKEKISKQFSWLTEHVETKLNEVIENIVKQYGFNIVLNMTIQETRAVLYADEKLDITVEVIKRLDKMLPDLKLPQID